MADSVYIYKFFLSSVYMVVVLLNVDSISGLEILNNYIFKKNIDKSWYLSYILYTAFQNSEVSKILFLSIKFR